MVVLAWEKKSVGEIGSAIACELAIARTIPVIALNHRHDQLSRIGNGFAAVAANDAALNFNFIVNPSVTNHRSRHEGD